MKTRIHGYTEDLRVVYRTARGFFVVVHDARKKRHCCRITAGQIVHPATYRYPYPK